MGQYSLVPTRETRNAMNNNNLSPAAICDQITADAARLKQTAYVGMPHRQLLNNLLKQVQKADFRALVGIEPGDENAKLKKQHYLVCVVEQVLALAERNQWNLCHREGTFYLYNGAFWKSIDKDELKTFLRQAAEQMGVEKFTARYFEFSKSLFEQFNESAHLPIPDVDRSEVKINLQNGTFTISTEHQQLRAPDAADFLTHQLPFAYDEQATAPLFQTFLDRVLPDPACQQLLAEYMGYVFVSPARLKLEKTLLLYGTGANGKSVFFEIIMALLGSDNVSNYSLQSLTTEPAYSRAYLATKLVNYASEINGKLEADTFKQLVSGEPVEARLPYGQPFIMINYAKLIFNCNELPTDVEHSNAYFRRFLIVPFGVTIPESEQDKELAATIIRSELSGVFNWVLAGLRRLLAQGKFTDPVTVQQQLDMYRKQSDSVRLFLDEKGYQSGPDYLPLKDVYRDYKAFCAEDGYRAVNSRNFKNRLTGIGVQTEKRNFGQAVYLTRLSEGV